MATKTHQSLIDAITKAEKALEDAKAEYKEFCKENPLKLSKQLTPHELRVMREKNSPSKLEDHKKANLSTAKNVSKANLASEIKGGK